MERQAVTKHADDLSPEEVARRMEETVRRMIKMPPKTQKGEPKRAPKKGKATKR